MPSFFKSAAALAMAGAAFANPLKRGDDSCLAAVTGKAALGDDNLRKEHCSSFIKTIVTPSAITVTSTITDGPEPSEWSKWKRDVTVCPNEVPNYASACNEAGYKSACKAWGVSGETTITIPATTSTKTVYLGKGGNGNNGNNGNGVCTSTKTEVITATKNGNGNNGNNVCTSTKTEVITATKTGCSGGVTTSTVTETSTKAGLTATETVTKAGGAGANVTVTATETKAAVTVTVTAEKNNTAGPTDLPSSGKCLNAAKAQEFVDAFVALLEYTSYNGTQGPPGRGYKYDVSAKYLAEDFTDYSDSINWMAGFPLGGVTFASKAAFDYGQGILQPELKMQTHFVDYSCNKVTFKWTATPPTQAKVMGINHMTISDDLTKIKVNHAEFNNAAWLSSFGLQCKVPAKNTTTTS